jgi:hypothetical protein
MPTCLACDKHFPFRVVINGKQKNLKSRKYCLDCSPFGGRNTRILDKAKRKEKGLDNPDCVCKACSRIYVYRREGQTKSLCNSCMTKKRRVENQVKIYDYKGTSCLICGYNRCIKALSFHHIDPAKKMFPISGNTQRSWGSLKSELDKCVLLCSICHTELHEGLISNDAIAQKEKQRLNHMVEK